MLIIQSSTQLEIRETSGNFAKFSEKWKFLILIYVLRTVLEYQLNNYKQCQCNNINILRKNGLVENGQKILIKIGSD